MALTVEERTCLDRDGYLVLAGVLDDAALARTRTAFDAALAAGLRQGVHVAVVPDDPALEGVTTHPRVLAAVAHVLGRPFVVASLGGRDPLPGLGQQGLHTDGCPPAPAGPFLLVTALWLLDDFTPENGPTRLLPGSHRWPRPLPKAQQQPEAHHPGERCVLASAGAVLLFNGHLWHSGTRNGSTGPRRVLQGQYRGRELVAAAEM